MRFSVVLLRPLYMSTNTYNDVSLWFVCLNVTRTRKLRKFESFSSISFQNLIKVYKSIT